MSNRKGTALAIISLIIGASGLGIGVFSILRFQVVQGPKGDPGIDGTLNNLVGVWESISGGPAMDYYLIFNDIQVNESDFFSLAGGNTSLQLTQSGWYRFNLQFQWGSLSSTYTYGFYIEKNTAIIHILEWLWELDASDYIVNKFIYVYSDGDDVFKFHCQNPSLSDSFVVTANQAYNQFVVEYVKEM